MTAKQGSTILTLLIKIQWLTITDNAIMAWTRQGEEQQPGLNFVKPVKNSVRKRLRSAEKRLYV